MSRRRISIFLLTFLLSATPVIAASTVGELRAENAASRAAVKEAAKERWEELKTNREAKREEVKANIQARREEVKAKVSAMRDGRKKQVVERVQSKLSDVNARRTDHFLKVLERLSTILDKIQSRTEKAKSEGKDVSSIETAIASARAAISSAESAANAQKARVYQITVNDDTTARNDVGATVKQLQEDLRAVNEKVKVARDAVHNVFQQIKTVVGSNKEATSSAVTP